MCHEYSEHWLKLKKKVFQRVFFFHQARSFLRSLSGTILFTLSKFSTPKWQKSYWLRWQTSWMEPEQGSSHHTIGGCGGNTGQSSLVWTVVCCYVFPIEGISCIVTAVEPLLVRKAGAAGCSVRFSPTVFNSTRGKRKLFSKAGWLGLGMLPDTEAIPVVLSGMVLCVLLWRGLETLLGPRTLDTWVRLEEFSAATSLSFSHINTNK